MHGYEWPINWPRTRTAANLWPVGPISDGGPEVSLVCVRVLGAQTAVNERTCFELTMATGPDTPDTPIAVTIVDKTELVWTMDWSHKEVEKKIEGANGLRSALSNSIKVHGACGYNRPCAQQYVGTYQSCMVENGRLIPHAS